MKITRIEIKEEELCEIVREAVSQKMEVQGKECKISCTDEEFGVVEFEFS